MSISIMTDVWKLDMEIHRKMILLSLADNASDSGRCWPSQPTIARRAGISTRQLRVHLHALVDDNWLVVLSLGNGRGHSTEYSLNVAKIKAEASDTKAEASDTKAEAHVTPTVIEPSLEPEEDRKPKILPSQVYQQSCEFLHVNVQTEITSWPHYDAAWKGDLSGFNSEEMRKLLSVADGLRCDHARLIHEIEDAYTSPLVFNPEDFRALIPLAAYVVKYKVGRKWLWNIMNEQPAWWEEVLPDGNNILHVMAKHASQFMSYLVA